MSRVDGIGGVFLRANDVKALVAWYEQYLGLSFRCFEADENYGLELFSRADDDPARRASTVFAIQRAKPPLAEGRRQVSINWRVLDLDTLLEALRAAGVAIEEKEDHECGKFAWVHDPEGNTLELYQPLKEPGSF